MLRSRHLPTLDSAPRTPIVSRASVASITILCAALAACSDGVANRTVTAPDARSAISEAPADLLASYTADGPYELDLSAGDASSLQAAAQTAAAQAAGAPQSASGGRASGHVTLPPFANIASERYSFAALSTDPSTPFAAKGEYEMELTTTTGRTNKIHGDVICMGISGNTARIAGQISKIWVNNVQVPIPAATHNLWVVVDNGEGQVTVDQVSPLAFANAATAQVHCATGTPTIVFPNQAGNIQVQP